MRLINTSTFRMIEVYDDDIPDYAILSHRWEENEPTFQDFVRTEFDDNLALKITEQTRFRKLIRTCDFARAREQTWLWIDTICIDKCSSAELSEAINSMFGWYTNATECYAYLQDVCPLPTSNANELTGAEDLRLRDHHYSQELKKSRWFTRGWTLQELLAPNEVYFLDTNWNQFAQRSELHDDLREITGIDLSNWREACIAQKMSWVAERKTARGEDIAYCLLGLFDINMPLLYGEGAVKAFVRLQQEIIRQSDDETIFAWINPEAHGDELTGMIALHPSQFASSGEVRVLDWATMKRFPYSLTNKGLQFEVPIPPGQRPWLTSLPGHRYGLVLNAFRTDESTERTLPINISLVSDPDGIWRRRWIQRWDYDNRVASSFGNQNNSPSTRTLWIKQDIHYNHADSRP